MGTSDTPDTAVSRRGALAGLGALGIGGWWAYPMYEEMTSPPQLDHYAHNATPPGARNFDGWAVVRGECVEEFEEPLQLTFVSDAPGVDNQTVTTNFSESFEVDLETAERYELVVEDAEGDRTRVGVLVPTGEPETIILSTCT